MLHEHFRQCLEDLDVPLARKIWHHVAPNMPAPKTDDEALIVMHVARTASQSVSRRARFYSHRWLLDNGYPSNLPDKLKPYAERMFSKVVEAVGISVSSNSSLIKPVTKLIEQEMSDAVADVYASSKSGSPPVELVKRLMQEAREGAYKKLLGISLPK